MSVPEQFLESIGRLPGIDVEDFARAMGEAPSVGIRVNAAKGVADAVAAGYPGCGRVPWASNGFHIDGRPLFTLNPLLHAGGFYVQDPSSMVYERLGAFALSLLGGPTAPAVLDMCAAPGGKTTALCAALPPDAVIIANEFEPRRVGALRENLTKWGWSASAVTNSDTSAFARAGELFDIVAVDAPCSGEGMMRKDEDAVAQWSESLTENCAALQREILANAVAALRPGGVLMYSTCTFNRRENEDNLLWAIEQFGLIPEDTGLAGVGGILPSVDPSVPALRFMPHATRGEGLFAAVLRKPGDGEQVMLSFPAGFVSGKKDKKDKKGGKRGEKGYKVEIPDFSGWLEDGHGWIFRPDARGESVSALTPELAAICDSLRPYAKIVQEGVTVAVRKGNGWIPAHPLALSQDYRREAFPSVGLDLEAALRYPRRDAVALPADTPRGIVAVTHAGLPLGFLNNLGSRANNLYPQSWKIHLDL